MSFRKLLLIAFMFICTFFFADKAKAQCTWVASYSNGWENSLADTNVLAGTTYGRTPQTYNVHSGTKSLYMNFVNTLSAGSLFYDRTIPVCPGAYYRLSVYLITSFGGSACNETVLITDSTGTDTLGYTITGSMGHTTWYHVVDSFTPVNSNIHFKLFTNVGGSAYNQGGDDLSMDDLSLSYCQQTNYDTVTSCSPGTTFNLFDSLRPALTAGGVWTGASTLSGGSLGTFSTASNTSGTYSYAVAGNAGCPGGLAQMLVHNYQPPSAFLGDDTTICNQPGLVINPVISGSTPVYQTWQDGSSGTLYSVTATGLYWLKDSNICGVHTDSVKLTFMNTPVPQSIGPLDTTLCLGAAVSYSLGTVPPVYDTLTWQDGTHSITYQASSAGHYSLTVANQCGAAIDTADLHIIHPPAVSSIGPRDTTVCTVNSLLLMPVPLPAGVVFIWQDGSNGSSYNATSTGLYWVKDSNMCGVLADSINVTFMTAPVPQSIGPADTTMCPGAVLTLGLGSVQPVYDTLTWQDGSHSATYAASGAGHYSLQIHNQCGTVTDTSDIQIMAAPQASSLGPRDTAACNGATLVLGPTPVPASATFLWQDGVTTTSTFSASQAGLYILQVSNICFTLADSINISTRTAPTPFSIGPGVSICTGTKITLMANPVPTGDSLMWQDGISHADSFVASAAGQYTLTAFNQCGSQSASAVVSLLPLPSVMIDPIPVQCDRDSVLLAPVTANINTYTWSTGSHDSVIYAKTSGTYTVTAANNCGSVTGSADVSLLTSPVKPFNGLTIDSCSAAQVVLDAQNPAHTYLWSTGQSQQFIAVTDSGMYYVTISDTGHCAVTDSVYVMMHDCATCRAVVPTAFTPNGDGVNETFKPKFECALQSYTMKIYDRWGEMVYMSEDQTMGWDGFYKSKAQPLGVYVFFVQYRNQGDKQESSITGNVTLLR